ncbi:MAG: hypothetical protein ACYC27_05770 [Armatimonadota bacterium]
MPDPVTAHGGRKTLLVIDNQLLNHIGDRIPDDFEVIRTADYDPDHLLQAVSSGRHLVWIGPCRDVPPEMWIGSFQPSAMKTETAVAESSPLILGDLSFNQSHNSSAYIKPLAEMPMHNVDEEVRTDFLPIIESRDRFGNVIGYPGVLMNYYAPSLVGRRFNGSQSFFFFFDEPLEAMDTDGWIQILDRISSRLRAGTRIRRVETDYASYKPGERAHVRLSISNSRTNAASMEIRISVKSSGSEAFRQISVNRRCLDANDSSVFSFDLPVNDTPGLLTVRVEVCQDLQHAEQLSVYGHPECYDRRDIGIVIIEDKVQTQALLEVDGPNIKIDGQEGFWAGTHYYPSSSWWEWVWKDFRPLQAWRDFEAIRRSGYRIARIWVDPILDEQVLRSMDAAIWLAAQHGIVLIITIFTQWTRMVAFEKPDGTQVSFATREIQDVNIYCASFRNLALQREYVGVLANRWKRAGNIIFNLANEACVRSPDESQMDPEAWGWEESAMEPGTLRDSMLFRRWGSELTAAIRKAGGNQIVLPGYMLSPYGGGDTYIGNRDADILLWHCYIRGLTGPTLAYYDTACINRPIILEEFGVRGWNNPGYYDEEVHYAIATGAVAAISYEWGVSWLAREMCFHPLPMREYPDGPLDPRSFEVWMGYDKGWPIEGVGLCPTPSGFGYGSIYHGTPFPADAAIALGRLGLMGKGITRSIQPEKIYILIRTAKNDNFEIYSTVIKRLWQMRVPFGIWHEDCIETIPESTEILICPDGVTPGHEYILDELSASGIKVYSGEDDGWMHSDDLPTISISPADSADMIVRRTTRGTMYSLVGSSDSGVSLTTEYGHHITLGLTGFGMVHDCSTGIDFMEASGEVIIDGRKVCKIDAGRVIISSDDGNPIADSGRIRLMVTEPATLEFERKIERCSIIDESIDIPLAVCNISANRLHVDSQMSRYVILLEMSK